MNFTLWLIIIIGGLALVFIVVALLADRSARKYQKKRKKEYALYMDRTLPCPKCFGRGRICRPGWKFTDDTPKKEFEEEMKVIDIPYLVREAMEEDGKKRGT